MTYSRILILFVLFNFCSLNAQQSQKDSTSKLVSKGTIFLGLSSDLSFGYSSYDRQFILPPGFTPKVGYFIADRLSLGLSYQTIIMTSPHTPKPLMYHNGSLELNHYFYARKNMLLYSIAGISFSQYSPQGYRAPDRVSTDLKLGAGISYRFKKMPNLGVSAEAVYYIDPAFKRQISKIPHVTFGVSYFIPHRKNKIKK